MNTAMNLNYTSKIINELSKLDYSVKDNEQNFAILKMIFEAIANFLDIDDAGIIYYNDSMSSYMPYVSSSRSTLFKQGKIDDELIKNLGEVIDEDDVYYFSSRNHANISLQQTLGLYGIQSGIYYVIRDFDDNHIFAIIYLFNRNKDLVLNTYLRETFLVVSLRIENYFEKRQISDYADAKNTENENILALANLFIYHVDDDYNITYITRSIKKLFPKIAVGQKCYNAMFGLDKRCRDCPLHTKKKKYFEIRKPSYCCERFFRWTIKKGSAKEQGHG